MTPEQWLDILYRIAIAISLLMYQVSDNGLKQYDDSDGPTPF